MNCCPTDGALNYLYAGGLGRLPVLAGSGQKKTLKRINKLVSDAARNPFEGIGKPEALSGDLSGFWSRRIDEANRLVYRATDTGLEIVACRFHYDS